MSYFNFNGKLFPVRLLTPVIDGKKTLCLVGAESFSKTLLPNGNYANDQARAIDEQISFYVPDDIINKGKEKITKFVEANFS
jgi:hypothetical protein